MTKKTPTAVCSTVNPSTSINVDSLLCDADALTLSELSNLLPLLTNTAVSAEALAHDNRDAVSALSACTELTTPNTKENTHD